MNEMAVQSQDHVVEEMGFEVLDCGVDQPFVARRLFFAAPTRAT
jgi:hypothetical protein